MANLRCESISKTFDGVQALRCVSLRFSPKMITAIIGPNGAGKTTLLNVVSGSLRPAVGRCFIDDIEITRLASYRVARMGFARTFQDLRLIEQVSVLDNILIARPNQRGEKLFYALLRIGVAREEQENREAAYRILDFVGLNTMVREDAAALSYGQQKLLSLACCIATGADILFLDEPVAGVDPLMREKILGLLLDLKKKEKTVIFIEHDISAVRKVADMVVVMDGGRVIAEGRPSDILERAEILEAYLA